MRQLACGVLRRVAWMVLLLSTDVIGQTMPGPNPPAVSATSAPKTSGESIDVNDFIFQGNTALSAAELEAVARHGLASAHLGVDFGKLIEADSRSKIRAWVARQGKAHPTVRMSAEDLETVRQCLTQAYVACGYVNSNAVLPDQDVKHHVLVYQIREGVLSRVNVHLVDQAFTELPEKPWHFTKLYTAQRMRVAAGRVLNVNGLQNELEIAKQDPNVTRVNAELKPDLLPDQSYLDLQIEEANRFHLALDFNNKRSPSVGAERFELVGSDTSVTGCSDTFNFRYTITDGDLQHIGFAGGDDFGFDYTHPVTPFGTYLQAAFDRSDEPIVEAPFNDLSIRSKTDSYAVTLRQDVYHTPDTQLAIFATLNTRSNNTNLLGQPYEFSLGETNGKSRVSAMRFGSDFSTRDDRTALSLRSTFNIGFLGLGSTVNGIDSHTGHPLPDSDFFYWLGQAQYVRRLGDSEIQAVFRGNLQLSANALLALEQFSIGGFDTVRGYRENEVVSDEGAVASGELHIPIYKKNDDFTVTLVPFTDIGYGWDYYGSNGSHPVLGSVGIGVIVHATSHFDAQIYYGHPFKYYGRTSNLQDNGIHFDILMSLF